MEGRTIRAMRKRFDELETEARTIAEWVGAAATAIDEASRIVVSVRRMVLGTLERLDAKAARTDSSTDLSPARLVDPAFQNEVRQCTSACRALIDRMRADISVLISLLHGIGASAQTSLSNLNEVITELDATVSTVSSAGVDHWMDRLSHYSPLSSDRGAAERWIADLKRRYPAILVDSVVGMYNDLSSADPEVEELHPDDLGPSGRRRLDESDVRGTRLENLSQLLEAHGRLDEIGGTERSVIDIKKVFNSATGGYHYVVAMPSTTEWNHLAPFFAPDQVSDPYVDAGATNDFDSNLGFVLAPKLGLDAETQYQRAVRTAMESAGITDADSIVYTGFSQAGIAAAKFASDPTMPGTPIGLVVNGTATNMFDIPSEVQVLEYRHEGDPIGWVDLLAGGSGENEHFVEAPAPDGKEGVELHRNDLYVDTATEHDAELTPQYSHFLGDVVDQQQYTWREGG